jgi:hypothetical protein
MPWWSWIVIWVALIALALLYVVLLGLKVWRDATRTMRTFEETSARLGAYQRQSVSEWEAKQLPVPERAAPGSAVFASPEQMKDDYLAAKEERRLARLQRRVARRKERGQLQSLRDITALKDVG